ncbi:MAG: LptA/OstA family protein [Cyanobacteria bacterium P01_H01_bin.130]
MTPALMPILTPALLAPQAAQGQTPPAPTVVRNPITVLSDIQESNSETGTIVARGNVFVDYPSRNLEATSAQAQYFSNERRLILSGDVLVLQEGNSLRAETVTYPVDEGRMIALPLPNKQVESIYLIPESQVQPGAAAPIDSSLLNGDPNAQPPAGADSFSGPVEVLDTPPATDPNATDTSDPSQGPFDF